MRQIEHQLRLKFKKAKEAEAKAAIQKDKSELEGEDVDDDSLKRKEHQNYIEMKQDVMEKFKRVKVKGMSHDEAKEKMYEPITSALGKVESAVKKVNEGVQQTDTDIKMLTHRQLPDLPQISFSSDASMLTPTHSPNKEVSQKLSPKLDKNIVLGPIAKEYLPRANDSKFGIWYDRQNKVYSIGRKSIQFDYDNIIIDNQPYVGTRGLWRLLTYTNSPDIDLYTTDDLNTYKNILFLTDSIYQNNDKKTNKPKSSSGQKYTSLIKNFWNMLKRGDENIIEHAGDGILKYDENKIEYKYIHNLNELLQRLHYIYAQEQAGNNNFHNEKLGVIQFIKSSLENVIDSPKGLEYLIRIVCSLPKGSIKEGSGLFNNLLNSLPFELHAPGFNYLGPGTKLEERLKRGDQPINKLDEAAREHDIFYRDHAHTKDRHKADEVLEHRAWERVKAPDADINEKVWAWTTTNAMKAKRYLGMGLKF